MLQGNGSGNNESTTASIDFCTIVANNIADNLPEDKNYIEACKSIAHQIQIDKKSKLSNKVIFDLIKNVSSKYHLAVIPKREHIIRYLSYDSHYRKALLVRPTKTASGVAVIAVMPKSFQCPHGRCIYCPGGVEFNTPMSYTGKEPSTRAAQTFRYDPYKQVKYKLQQLQARGHNTGKVELVIVGGTFPFMSEEYQKDFAKSCFDALNDNGNGNQNYNDDYYNNFSISFFSRASPCTSSLQQAIKTNETANTRCVGFTVETKPDYCRRKHIDLMLELGITRIEIGIQSLRDDVYRAVNRGHTLNDVVDSFQLARDAGYKIVAHMMPGLPNSSLEKDIQDFKTLFQDPRFKPDMLKIYPTLVLKNTGLHELYKSGRYYPYSEDDLIDLLVEVKKMVPPWIRIMRVQREIDPNDIVAGSKSGNLRQIVLKKLKAMGLRCNCIRCREVGLQKAELPLHNDDHVVMNRIDYRASNGQEVFLSFVTKDESKILGFLRLRRIANPFRKELCDDSDNKDYNNSNSEIIDDDDGPSYNSCITNINSTLATTTRKRRTANTTASTTTAVIVRELHVYGPMLNIGIKGSEETYQHRGYGIQLMMEAERIAKKEFGVNKLSVISAVGTREYYKKIGYIQNGPYVSKELT